MKRIFLAGHRGMVGSAILRELSKYDNDIVTVSREEVDLRNQFAVSEFFKNNDFDQVFLAAAKVGGIHANSHFPADFIYDNLLIQSNVIGTAAAANVKKLLFLGSSCIYPKFANQPMLEAELLAGKLEATNEPYAIAKIAGIKLCESFNRQYGTDFRSLMPTNLYGPGDNFSSVDSHVVPALIRRFHEATLADEDAVEIWGSGRALREFLHVDDLARACILTMGLSKNRYHSVCDPMLSHLNVGSGQEYTIEGLATLIAKVVGFKGKLVFDVSKPDGTPRKLLDSSKLKELGFSPEILLEEGLRSSYQWFVSNAVNT